jgi:Restriction endonuclease BglII
VGSAFSYELIVFALNREFSLLEKLSRKGYQILALHHAEAILRHDMPEAIEEIEAALEDWTIEIGELVSGGGGEAVFTQRLRRRLSDDFHWAKHNFEVKRIVDGIERESISHEIDHVKTFPAGTIALEIEWNNKDPFYDRDLENFKRLHADGVISIGVIITRGTSLHEQLRLMISNFATSNNINSISDLSAYYNPTERQKKIIQKNAESKASFPDGWAHSFVSDKFGEATTHWGKLADRVDRGVGNPCPLLLIGIPADAINQ